MDARDTRPENKGERVWVPSIVDIILRFLPDNVKACTVRLVDKMMSQQLAGLRVVRLSRPSPTHAFFRRWGYPGAFRGLTKKQRLKYLCLTAASGSVANLEVALDNAGLLVTRELLEAAAEAGQLEACMLLRGRGCHWFGGMLAAARGGHWHVCEWLLANGCPLDRFAVREAVRGGHEDLTQRLRDALQEGGGAGLEVGALLAAAAHGLGLEALQQLHQQLLEGQQQQPPGGGEAQPHPVLAQALQGQVLAAAAGSPTADWQAKVEWLEGLGYPRTAAVCNEAASSGPEGGAVGRLQWLHGRGYPMQPVAAHTAAVRGDLDAVRFLVETANVLPTDSASVFAASHGHLAVLQCLRANGIPMSREVVSCSAAKGGHLHVVAWAVEALGVTPGNTAGLLDAAVEGGSVELMAWLRQRGWNWGNTAIGKAAGSGCEEALEWLVERGCPFPADGAPFAKAASHGDLAMVRCLQRLGCPWGQNLLVRCIRHSTPVPMLRCLVDLGCPVDLAAATTAAEAQRPGEYRSALVAWLGEQQQEQQQLGV